MRLRTGRGDARAVKSEPEQMVSMCHQLLDQADVEAAIRVGDVYALMVEWFYSQRQMEEGPAACTNDQRG